MGRKKQHVGTWFLILVRGNIQQNNLGENTKTCRTIICTSKKTTTSVFLADFFPDKKCRCFFCKRWLALFEARSFQSKISKEIIPENGWLENKFPFGTRPIFRGKLRASRGLYPCRKLAIGPLLRSSVQVHLDATWWVRHFGQHVEGPIDLRLNPFRE